MKKSNCEQCAYFTYNENYGCYECMINLDEDEMAHFLQSSNFDCRYFRFSDDYRIVKKQI